MRREDWSEIYLPGQQPPELLVTPQVRDHLYVEEVFGVCNADEDRGSDYAEEKGLGYPRRREARGKHGGGWGIKLLEILCSVGGTRAVPGAKVTRSFRRDGECSAFFICGL